MRLVSAADLCRAGLGADRQIPKFRLPILNGDVISHHLLERGTGFSGVNIEGFLSFGEAGGNGRAGEGFLCNQTWHHGHALVGNATHKGKHGTGIHQVLVLSHTGPA